MTQPANMDRQGPWLTTAQVAKQLQFSIRTVIRYCAKNRFPGAKKTEKQWRIPQSGINCYLRDTGAHFVSLDDHRRP